MNKDELDAVRTRWSLLCGACDGGLPQSCTHPAEDPRDVILQLCDELAKVIAERDEARRARDQMAENAEHWRRELAAAREQAEQARAELATMTAVAKSNKRVTEGYAQELGMAYRLLKECFDAYHHLMDIGDRREEISAFLAANAGYDAKHGAADTSMPNVMTGQPQPDAAPDPADTWRGMPIKACGMPQSHTNHVYDDGAGKTVCIGPLHATMAEPVPAGGGGCPGGGGGVDAQRT